MKAYLIHVAENLAYHALTGLGALLLGVLMAKLGPH